MNQNYYRIISMTIVLLLSSVSAELNKLPDFINVCHRSDPELSDCVYKQVELLRQRLNNGIPELTVPPIEPLEMGNLYLTKKNETGLELFVERLKVYNIDFKVQKMQVTKNLEQVSFDLLLPKFNVDGVYNLDGVILFLALKTNGSFDGTFKNITAKVKLFIEVVNRNDVEYFSIKSIKIKVRMGTGHLNLKNLFGNNKSLSQAINQSINDNISDVANELLPSIEKTLQNKFVEIGQKIFQEYTAEQLFPM